VGDDLGRARQGGSPRTLGRLLAAIFHIRRHDPHLRCRDATNHKKVSRPHRRDRASAAFAVLDRRIFVGRYRQCKTMMACPLISRRTVALSSRSRAGLKAWRQSWRVADQAATQQPARHRNKILDNRKYCLAWRARTGKSSAVRTLTRARILLRTTCRFAPLTGRVRIGVGSTTIQVLDAPATPLH
jgi:hypothetical protein